MGRIGVLEWITGGGLQAVAPDSVAGSLRQEGKAMLETVADGFRLEGHEVLLSVDHRLFTENETAELAQRFRVSTQVEFVNGLPASWWHIAKSSDAVLIIAPEFSGILQSAIERLSNVGSRLMNCHGSFLNIACDKWLTAQRWVRAEIPHPATQLLASVTNRWLDENRNVSAKWVVKPRDGAGCEGIKLVDEGNLLSTIAECKIQGDAEGYVVQPFHLGRSFSRSVIVDSHGRSHWLPLVSQELVLGEKIIYQGGEIVGLQCIDGAFDDALKALGEGAVGWVGFDLMRCEGADQWRFIEANARLTTSFAGLSRSYGKGLAEQLWQACLGGEVKLESDWRRLKFDASGEELPL